MFKIGERVVNINKNTILHGIEGTVKGVDSSRFPIIYEIDFDGWNAPVFCAPGELAAVLPVGTQMTLGSASLLLDENTDEFSLYGLHEDTPDYKRNGPKCDCGGFKVYGVLSAEAHSPWCSIFGKKG